MKKMVFAVFIMAGNSMSPELAWTCRTNRPRAISKIKFALRSYPTIEQGGVIWAYMGPQEKQPESPGMEWSRAPEQYRAVSKTIEYANYAQAVEGGIDTVHSSFRTTTICRTGVTLSRIDTAPQVEVERTSYGFRYAGIRNLGEIGNYVRIYQFVLPFHQFRSHQVPIRKAAANASPCR